MLQQLISAIEGTTKHLISCQIQATSTVGKNATISEQACTVCLESKSLQDFDKYGIGNCTHPNRTICDNCMYEHVRHTWNVNSDIYCPECSVSLSHITTKQILFNHGDSLLYERYAKFDLDRCLEENPEFVWCAHGCGSGQLSEGATMNKTVECINCHKLTCFIHKCPWHDGMTCEEYEMPRTDGQTHASQRWINIHTKECSKCHSHIEKNDGCDHMTCFKCKYEFCWECLAPYSGIKRHGAYLHRRTCKHYPATDTRNILKRLIDLF